MEWKLLSIKVQKSTKDLIPLCKDEFVVHHREFKGKKLSNDFIIFKALTFYLEND